MHSACSLKKKRETAVNIFGMPVIVCMVYTLNLVRNTDENAANEVLPKTRHHTITKSETETKIQTVNYYYSIHTNARTLFWHNLQDMGPIHTTI